MNASAFAAAALFAAPAIAGVTLPAVEAFNENAANWRDAGGSAELSWVASGSFDGSGYVSTSFNFANTAPEDTPILFRAQDEYGSSGGAFVGDWIASGAAEFSFWVRHDAITPLNFLVRFTGPANFPGAVALEFAPVLANTWTQISIDLNAMNPAFISFEGTDFETVFSNIGHIQIGVSAPEALAGLDQSFTFDLDHAALIPAPGALGLLCFAGVCAARRRR